MKELVLHIAQALVDRPDDVRVNRVLGSQCEVYELSVAKEDVGKLIGKMGRTAAAIRTILGAVAGKGKKRIMLEIIE